MTDGLREIKRTAHNARLTRLSLRECRADITAILSVGKRGVNAILD